MRAPTNSTSNVEAIMGMIGRTGFKLNASCAAGAVGRQRKVVAPARLPRVNRRAEPATHGARGRIAVRFSSAESHLLHTTTS